MALVAIQGVHVENVGAALVAAHGKCIKNNISEKDGHKGHPYITFIRFDNIAETQRFILFQQQSATPR